MAASVNATNWAFFLDLNVLQVIQQYEVLRTLIACSQNDEGKVLSFNLPIHDRISATVSTFW